MIIPIIIFVLLVCLCLTVRLESPEKKGERGEANIVKDLWKFRYDIYGGYCLRNVYVPYKGKTTEIDVVYITPKGIFVIESKNLSGYIFGSENQPQWTTTLYAGANSLKSSYKYKFYNPIWQNTTHIKALQEYLGEIRVYSFVVFGSNCELKSINYNPENVCICREDSFKNIIKQKLGNLETVYDKETMDLFYERLLPLTGVNTEIREQHINSIKEITNGYICPRCGGKLVLRTAKNGKNAGNKFYGCSNYPSCRYTRNI